MADIYEPNIVVIGGGTGTFGLLSGLKDRTPHLTALVSMADDGGSTGMLRDEYDVLPPGDIRKALIALARTPQMRNLFDYRFSDGGLAGHSFGNLFLSTVEKMSDNFAHAVQLAGTLLNIQGQVLPITLDKVTLALHDGDRTIRGEAKLSRGVTLQNPRPTVQLEPQAHITAEAKAAILDADAVVIAPGSLYSSLAAALVVDGVADALAASRAKKIFVCNLVSEHGQTDGFDVRDYAAEIERFLDNKVKLDYVLYNTHEPNPDLLQRYESEDRTWVSFDRAKLQHTHFTAVGDNFLSPTNGGSRTLIRHDSDKVADTLLQIARSRGTVRRMNVTKAIIPMAGYGTRRLPITKAIEKCMLPVGNRPVIDYVVEDCIRAGITEFIFVVGEEFDQIKRYYGQNQILEEYLESKGKHKELEEVRALNKRARFHYVVQDQYQPYGTTVPLWLSRHLIKPGESFLYVSGDQFFWREDGSSEMADFLQQADAAGTPTAMLGNEVPWEDVHLYGIISTKQDNGVEILDKVLEKPKREEATTNLNNSTCWLLNSDILPFVNENMEHNNSPEHFFTDPANAYAAAGNKMAVVRAKGHYMDCGTTKTWLRANQRIIDNEG